MFNFHNLRPALLPCCLLFALAGAVAAQDDKAGYEKGLEQKSERALVSLLGPGKARVSVRLPMDFHAGDQGKPITVFIALSDSVTEAEAEKTRDTINRLLGLASERGDEVLVMKPGNGAGQAEPENSGGLGRYLPQGLWVLAGVFITLIFSRIRKAAVEVRTATAARLPPQALPPAQYIPPPAPAQPAGDDNDDLNIPSRSGFYKR